MDFSFPFEPYPIQRDLMTAVYECIENGNIGIFESPTGTGKSLSLICATLTWLRDHEQKSRIQLQEQVISNDKVTDIFDDDDDDDWVGTFRQRMDGREKSRQAEQEIMKLDRIKGELDRIKRKNKIESKFGCKRPIMDDFLGENDTENCDADSDIALPECYCSDDEETANVSSNTETDLPQCVKIYYCSRTHSQLEQFANEIRKTGFSPRMVTLGSRQVLCLNESVKSLNSVGLMNDRCLELRNAKGKTTKMSIVEHRRKVEKKSGGVGKCPFHKKENMQILRDSILNAELSTTDQMIESGISERACPYFASRMSLPLCELVLLPYQVGNGNGIELQLKMANHSQLLLHDKSRTACGINLVGNVVVIDEAHNLLETISSIHSTDLSHHQISLTLSVIREYVLRFRQRLAAKNLLYIRQLTVVLTAFERLVSSTKIATIFTMVQFLIQSGLIDVNIFKLVAYVDKTELCRKLHGFCLKYQGRPPTKQHEENAKQSGVARLMWEKSFQVDGNTALEDNRGQLASASPMYLVRAFLQTLTNKCTDGRILLETSKATSKLRFLLLNPAEKLTDLTRSARAVILAGGTMEPSFQLVDALTRVCRISSNKLTQFACNHVINDDQLLVIALKSGPNNDLLNFNFEHRNMANTLASLGMTLCNFLRQIPNGVVIFFPSYDYMNTVVRTFDELGTLKRINVSFLWTLMMLWFVQDMKPVFQESKSSDLLWMAYAKAARSATGAALFAVINGKMSEGINFSDQLGRAVIVIGLPYPNRNTVEIKAKLQYLDTTLGPEAGNAYCEAVCMRAINQSIGRAIRHVADHAIVLLIDERFTQVRIQNRLPAWIRRRLRPISPSFSENLRLIRQFFRDKNC